MEVRITDTHIWIGRRAYSVRFMNRTIYDFERASGKDFVAMSEDSVADQITLIWSMLDPEAGGRKLPLDEFVDLMSMEVLGEVAEKLLAPALIGAFPEAMEGTEGDETAGPPSQT